MTKIYVRPIPGKRVRNPDKDYEVLSARGAPVKPSTYWHRRLKAGEVEEITAEQYRQEVRDDA